MSDQLRDTQEQQEKNGSIPPAENTEVKGSTNGGNKANGSAADKPLTLEEQLTQAQAQAAEYLDGWQRARAEFVNYRKRADKEREDALQNGTIETLKKLLPVVDDFDRAINNVPADKAQDDLIKGFSLIHRKFSSLLENAGVKVINPVGEAFDPALHEAIGQDESSDMESGHITMVLQKGYIYGDRVLRPALVRVAG